MSAFPEPLLRLMQELKRLPGIGEKSAARIAFHLLAGDRERADALGAAASTLHDLVTRCRDCGNFTEAQPCGLCRSGDRTEPVLCVVEDPADIAAVEKPGTFRGRYHVLAGGLSGRYAPEDDPQIRALIARVRGGSFEEVLLATNPTNDGESTAALLAHFLQGQAVRVTRIGIGIPMGSELVHTDRTTMAEALQHRSEIGMGRHGGSPGRGLPERRDGAP